MSVAIGLIVLGGLIAWIITWATSIKRKPQGYVKLSWDVVQNTRHEIQVISPDGVEGFVLSDIDEAFDTLKFICDRQGYQMPNPRFIRVFFPISNILSFRADIYDGTIYDLYGKEGIKDGLAVIEASAYIKDLSPDNIEIVLDNSTDHRNNFYGALEHIVLHLNDKEYFLATWRHSFCKHPLIPRPRGIMKNSQRSFNPEEDILACPLK